MSKELSTDVAAWQRAGSMRHLCGQQIFTLEVPASGEETQAPLLVLHGFPSSSFDYHAVVGPLSSDRRILLLDLLGYGFSAKPDQRYTMSGQADIVMAYVSELGVREVALLTHDMGDTVGGELLARHLAGEWDVEITRRVITNGSIYIEMAHLTDGQQFLLSLPDARLDTGPVDGSGMQASLRATFSAHSAVEEAELIGMWECIAHNDGFTILPRLIRYIEERRQHQDRFTGAIETHPSPLDILWGHDDPIAVVEMATRLAKARPDARSEILDQVGHYPMVEAPERFASVVKALLGSS
jgi:pimeloyl-ACP methyl ester carboxylesterase